ncbi:hypothetical protein EVC37_25080 [Methylocaldum sp. BRCS4]|nr:hypothetical protein [Methylocaldum sp. BRCS4]
MTDKPVRPAGSIPAPDRIEPRARVRVTPSIYQIERLIRRESQSILSVLTTSDEDPPLCSLRSQDTVELPDFSYPDLEGFPALALDQPGLATAPENQVDAAVCTA